MSLLFTTIKFQYGRKSDSGIKTTTSIRVMMMMTKTMPAYFNVCANQNPGKIFRFECATTLIFYIGCVCFSLSLSLLCNTMRASVHVCIVIHEMQCLILILHFTHVSLSFIYLPLVLLLWQPLPLPLLPTAIVDSFLSSEREKQFVDYK